MTEVLAFTSTNVMEGLVAVSVYASLTYLIRDYLKRDKYLVLVIGWFITWICRKTAVNIYKKYLEMNKIKETEYKIVVPFL
jgi:hypothetical protein